MYMVFLYLLLLHRACFYQSKYAFAAVKYMMKMTENTRLKHWVCSKYANPFYATGLSLYPLKTKNQLFCCFQGVIDRGQCLEMG